MEWVILETLYDTKDKAIKTASIISITESRLASQSNGPQYEIETRVEAVDGKWRVSWRKIFVGYKKGCGGCQSCHSTEEQPPKTGAKIIPFRKP